MMKEPGILYRRHFRWLAGAGLALVLMLLAWLIGSTISREVEIGPEFSGHQDEAPAAQPDQQQ
jgi:hypothetical protein